MSTSFIYFPVFICFEIEFCLNTLRFHKKVVYLIYTLKTNIPKQEYRQLIYPGMRVGVLFLFI